MLFYTVMPNQDFERVAYVFQGGGALGAYQLGIYKALHEHDYLPDWVIGTSIGAINATIIAGNKPADRVAKLQEFWQLISTRVLPGYTPQDDQTRQWYNYISAQTSMFLGQPNMFSPRFNNPLFETHGSADTISFYVATPLHKTLEKLVDFDLINSNKVRLTLGAVEVRQGRAIYFDSTKDTIGPEHVLASCALPPAFAAVKIKDDYYWDGGVLSNTPVQAIIHDPKHVKTLCFMANLFDSFGLNPKTLDDVMKRYKDIMYSSQDRAHLYSFIEIIRLKREMEYLYNKMPIELQQDPEVKKIYEQECNITTMHFVRFLYTAPHNELSSKDFEFSKLSVDERIQTGYKDGLNAVNKSPWLAPVSDDVGVKIHEICSHDTVQNPW